MALVADDAVILIEWRDMAAYADRRIQQPIQIGKGRIRIKCSGGIIPGTAFVLIYPYLDAGDIRYVFRDIGIINFRHL